MSVLDLTTEKEKVGRIVFADNASKGDLYYTAVNNVQVCGDLYSLEDAKRLIKAVEKSIELGWFE